MKKLFMLLILFFILPIRVSATEYIAPTAPYSAQEYIPESSGNFGKDLWYVVSTGIEKLLPDIGQAALVCGAVISVVMLISIWRGMSEHSAKTADIVAVVSVGTVLLSASNAMVHLGVDTVSSVSEYGKLLLPVMTAALAAQGGMTTSAALYAGTIIFNTVLSTVITTLMIPLIYAYIALSIAGAAVGEGILKNLKDFLKWLMTWSLKIAIYLFTGYMGITGVISGTADAAALKAAKLTLTGTIPVVGGIISDASETLLVSTGIMKNTAGTYGLIAILAIYIGPFIQIGIQYLLLKLTAGIGGLFGCKSAVAVIRDFSVVMGLILGATGTICIIHIISIVCFLKGFL